LAARDLGKKRAAVPQASANVAEAYGMAESCGAAVGDAWMAVLLRFIKVPKKIKKCTAPTVAVSDVLLMGFAASGGRSCATASRPRYADTGYLRRICVNICAT
jgi:hypothetical protein